MKEFEKKYKFPTAIAILFSTCFEKLYQQATTKNWEDAEITANKIGGIELGLFYGINMMLKISETKETDSKTENEKVE